MGNSLFFFFPLLADVEPLGEQDREVYDVGTVYDRTQ